jgi:F0F1-type ATP synthase epsilon subunit
MWVCIKSRNELECYNMEKVLLVRIEEAQSTHEWQVIFVMGGDIDWDNEIVVASVDSEEKAQEIANEIMKAVGGTYSF